MPKYNSFQFAQEERKWEVHPVWRGIGCALMVIVPILSYLGAAEFVRANQRGRWLPVPPDVAGTIDFSPVSRLVPALSSLVKNLDQVYYMDLIMTVVFTVIAFGLLTVVYSIFYRAAGPERYGPTDAPPIKKSPRKGYGRSR
jgi:hypothetical protein